MPKICLSKTDKADHRYLTTEVDGIRIHYPEDLRIKEGFTHIKIRLRRFLFWSWLEMEGARGTTVYSE